MSETTFYSATQVCEMLKLSRSALQRLVNAGVLRPLRVGKLLKFDVLEINRYLAAGRPTASQSRLSPRRK